MIKVKFEKSAWSLILAGNLSRMLKSTSLFVWSRPKPREQRKLRTRHTATRQEQGTGNTDFGGEEALRSHDARWRAGRGCGGRQAWDYVSTGGSSGVCGVEWHLLLLVQTVDGGVGLLSGREGNEAEATAAAGLAVLQDDLDGISTRFLQRER